MELKDLQKEWGLRLTENGRIYIKILTPPNSVFCPLDDSELNSCVIITQEEFEQLIYSNEEGVISLLTELKNR